jgi:20S proteasome subunit beta 5
MLSLETRSEKENLIEDVSENLIPSGISSIKIPPFENVIIKNKLFFSFSTLFLFFLF